MITMIQKIKPIFWREKHKSFFYILSIIKYNPFSKLLTSNILIILNQTKGTVVKILGTFPKNFPQVATSQGYFPKWQLPKCAITQAATSHSINMPFYKWRFTWIYVYSPFKVVLIQKHQVPSSNLNASKGSALEGKGNVYFIASLVLLIVFLCLYKIFLKTFKISKLKLFSLKVCFY